MGFLSFIFYLFLGLWLFGIISRWLLRFWIQKKQRQMEEQMRNGGAAGGQAFGGNFGPFSFGGFTGGFGGPTSAQKKSKPEGEITIEQASAPVSEHSVNKQVGDYVDFEEVSDK